MSIVVAALYKFVPLEDYEALQPEVLACCKRNKVKGSLLLAAEGINGTIAGTRTGIDRVLSFLRKDPRLEDLDHKESFAEEQPFLRMKVRLKKEIVTLGVPQTDPLKKVGTYVEPEAWNDVISDPEVILVDTRNDYEVALGTFKNAKDPKTKSFREFPEYVKNNLAGAKKKKIAMMCTGGIRCEKASSYLLDQGFEEVLHLKGGILKYLERIPKNKSLWEGECFVFDNRVTVKHDLTPGAYDLCHACRMPISEADKALPTYEEGVHCYHCYDQKSEKSRRRAEERQNQVRLAKARGEKHIGTL